MRSIHQRKSMIIWYLFAIGHISCSDFFETTIKLDPPLFEKKMVIFAEAKAGDSTIQIRVTENFGILDNTKDTTIINPQLIFSINGITQSDYTYTKGYYKLKLEEPLRAGQKCDLTVTHSGFKPVFATQTVPDVLSLKSIKYIENGGITTDGDPRSRVDVNFTDGIGKDFYEVVVLLRNGKDQPYNSIRTTVNVPGAVDGIKSKGVIFSDQSFDSKEKMLGFQFRKIPEQQAKGNIQIRWYNISEATYKYNKTGDAHFESRDNPFATPSDLYTNVEGGLGYFFITNQKTYNVPF